MYFQKQEEEEKKKKKQRKKRREKYNWITLFGFEESQTIPVWSHKSFPTFQFKLPFDVNEL